MRCRLLPLCLIPALLAVASSHAAAPPPSISGRYPHLAMFNHQGECGTGAVVPWAGKLWVLTYSPHMPGGSDDKLYAIDADLNRTTMPESVGGTPANRLIHRESKQLNIGPYFIDAEGKVRVVPPSKMYGRLTGTARHLTDPANKVYICDMEGLIYEVDVHTLAVKLLFKRPVPGWHCKGGYSGQGRLVVANNGESAAGSVDKFKPFDYFIDPKPTGPEDAGALAEWDGKTWRLVARRQFLDVTGPGGIEGPADDKAPLWAIGWDRRSLLLLLCDGGQWSTFRLPIADYSYFGKHGWHTEWPRIREVTDGKLLMNLHGGWFDFPKTFAAGKTGGLRPVADYLKITADFCAWNGRIVFGCDDTAKSGFSLASLGDTLNRLNGQSNSNLWFTTWNELPKAGRPAGYGGPWVGDDVKADVPSAPYLFAGYGKTGDCPSFRLSENGTVPPVPQRVLHLAHQSKQPIKFLIEFDKAGDGQWTKYETVAVGPGGYAFHIFPADVEAQWVRLTPESDAAKATAYFHYGPGGGAATDRKMFAAIADVDQPGPWTSAVVRSEGEDRITLGVLSHTVDANGKLGEARTYQVGPDMQFKRTEPDSASATFLRDNAQVTKRTIDSDDASVIVREGKLQMRLPKNPGYDAQWAGGWPRALRELVTERSLLNAAGTFYLVPRENSGGLRRIKPVCTHNKRITDFCSWRGLTVIAGCAATAKPDGHYFAADDGKAGLWFGDIDDLWQLGKPVGVGGPWRDSTVEAGKPSDPYLMLGYDQKTLDLKHDARTEVRFTIEVDVAGEGVWFPYKTVGVPAGKPLTHAFPAGYSAHWVRLTPEKACKATAVFTYK